MCRILIIATQISVRFFDMTTILIIDMILVGYASFVIIKNAYPNSPRSRLAAVLGLISMSALYGFLFAWAFVNSIHPIPAFFIFFGPIVLLLLFFITKYIREK